MLFKLNPNAIELGSLRITWYAIFIIGGAILCYLLANKMGEKKGLPKGIIENVFYISFPLGIVGARIWFVLSNLSMYQGANWYHIFYVWEGGLAIQGGVVVGVLCAIWYLRKKHPDISPLEIFDLCVPNILLGQAIGRWGNFFNQEVYGACVVRESLSFLPNFILNQMAGGGDIACKLTEVAQPLFLYESLLDLAGWLIISFLLRYKWTKNRPYGILTMLYFVYYGAIRACLEPLRNEAFIMRINGVSTSLVTSIVYIILGVAGIIAIYLYHRKHPFKARVTTEPEIKEEKPKKAVKIATKKK